MPRGYREQATSFIIFSYFGRMRILHPRNWSVYSRKLSGDKEALRKFKRIILLSQFTLFGTVAAIIHAAEDLIDGGIIMPLMDLTLGAGVFICYLLNEKGKYKIAKIALFTFLNVFFFVYACAVPEGLGIYLYYFPWVALATVVFENEERIPRFSFIALSVLLVIILFYTDFDALGLTKLPAVDIERSFIINMISSITILIFLIVFMSVMNEQSEEKLVELAYEVRSKNGDLQKVNRELDRFFYSTTHDLRIPLKDINGMIDTALADIKDEKILNYFLLLKDRTQHLESFLQDVIDYSRNTQTAVKSEPVHVQKLVEEVIGNFRFVKDADRIRFEKEILVDSMIEIDRVRFVIVLNNIISNAIKYQRKEINDCWVHINIRYEGEKISVCIEDNGQGIQSEMLPKIFNMFFRATQQSKGSGLGLYIVKETIDKMGGTIEVKSTLGVGTRFTIMLPVRIVTAMPESSLSTQVI
jgi:signal transduction histidine kinase